MKTVFNIVLGLCALALIYICYSSIMGPINFENAKKQRDQAVIARLIDIRKAQMEFRNLNKGQYTASFDTLIDFVKNKNCLLYTSPVGEEQSPALFTNALKGYGLEVREVDLTQVVRQVQDSGILWNATRLRELIAKDECNSLPKIRILGFADIRMVPGGELIDTLTACYERDGMDETIVVCRSNKRANICLLYTSIVGALMIIFALSKSESRETEQIRNSATRNAIFLTVLFVFGGMLYRVATGDLITVDTSSFLTFLIMNVLCLEFGMKKAMVDKIFKR